MRLVREKTQDSRVEAKLMSSKNQGTYGSGVNDMVLELTDPNDAGIIKKWPADEIIRLVLQ